MVEMVKPRVKEDDIGLDAHILLILNIVDTLDESVEPPVTHLVIPRGFFLRFLRMS